MKCVNFDSDKFLLDNPNDLISLDKWQQTVNLLAELFEAPAGFLVQFTPEGFQTTICSEQESNPYPPGVVIEPEVNIFCRRIVETGEELYVNNAPTDPCWDTNPEVHNDGFHSYLGVPVFWPDGKPFGTFCVMDFEITHYSDTYFKLIRQLRDILESDLALLDLYQQVQQLAITDPLTGISNRRGFTMLAEQRIKLAKRMESNLVLCYADVDRFKQINDQHGHTAGDAVLTTIARSLEQNTRQSDVIGRLGGDEFVALLLIKHPEDSGTTLNRLEQAINTAQEEGVPSFTVTLGMTEVVHELNIEQLLDKADAEMLKRKRTG